MSYKSLYSFMVAIMLIMLIMYFAIKCDEIKNLVGNIFAGLVSGLVLAILSNKRNAQIKVEKKKLKLYCNIMKDITDFEIKLSKILVEETINKNDLIQILVSITRFYTEFSNIKEKNVNMIIDPLNIETEKEEIMNLLSKISNEEKNSISKERFNNLYKNSILKCQINNSNLCNFLKIDIENIDKEKEKLETGII